MPGYYIHLAACGNQSLENQRFKFGVLAPDYFKKLFKLFGGIDSARLHYSTIRKGDTTEFDELEHRIQQKEQINSSEGLHFGLSSQPNVRAFWNSLTETQKKNPFYRGYAWHLLTDAIIYGRLNIDARFQNVLDEYRGSLNIDELRKQEAKRLHEDWDKTNALVRDTYPGISLPDEIKELGVVQFITGTPFYVDWSVLKSTIDYLRTFDPINGDMEKIIEKVLSNI